jgi:hypothetical protein
MREGGYCRRCRPPLRTPTDSRRNSLSCNGWKRAVALAGLTSPASHFMRHLPVPPSPVDQS